MNHILLNLYDIVNVYSSLLPNVCSGQMFGPTQPVILHLLGIFDIYLCFSKMFINFFAC